MIKIEIRLVRKIPNQIGLKSPNGMEIIAHNKNIRKSKTELPAW